MLKAKKGVYQFEEPTPAEGNTTWFWLNSTVAQYVQVGDELLIGNGISGVVEKKGFWGWKLRCPDGSVYRISRWLLEGYFWFKWISEQPDI